MNIKEKKAKIQELKEQIETLEKEISSSEIGYKDDPIFLLSIDEHKIYKEIIPYKTCWWWLRSPGHLSGSAASVDDDGSVDCNGFGVNYDNDCVRPALKLVNVEEYDELSNGDRIIECGFPFIVIDAENGIAIAEVPIGFKRFDSKSNDYETSEIRQFLLDWYKERK